MILSNAAEIQITVYIAFSHFAFILKHLIMFNTSVLYVDMC